MDEALRFLLTMLTTVMTLLLTLIANGVRVIYNKQKDSEIIISAMKVTLGELSEWKNKIQNDDSLAKDEEIRQLKSQIKELMR